MLAPDSSFSPRRPGAMVGHARKHLSARLTRMLLAAAFVLPLVGPLQRAEAETQSFAAGSLIIPMDADMAGNHASFNQNLGMWKAYGLVYRLLQNGIPVQWAIEPGKSFDDVDFTVAGTNDLRTGTSLATWNYRGGPFVVDSAYAPAALPIIQTWWATKGNQPNVHKALADFTANVDITLRREPRIANEESNAGISIAYYNAAGIPDLNGSAWTSQSPNILDQTEIAGGALFEQGVCVERRFDTFVTPHNNGYAYSLTDPANLGTRTYAELDRFVHQGGGWTALCHSILSNENSIARLTLNGTSAVKALFATSDPGGQPGGFLTYGGFTTISNTGGVWTVPGADLPVGQAVSTTVAQALPGGSVQNWPSPGFVGSPSYYPETERVAYFDAGVNEYDHIIAGPYHNGTGLGKVTYIGGHSFSTALPYSGNFEAPYLRNFYNSLFFNGGAVARLDLAYAPATFPQNGTQLLSVSVVNTGGSPALDAGAAPGSVSIVLNAGFTYVSTTLGPAPTVVENSPAAGFTTVAWTDLGDVGAGATAVTIQVQVDASVSGTVGSKQLGTFHANYGDVLGEQFTADVCRSIEVTPIPAPSLAKTPVTQGPVHTGDLVSWNLTYSNTGSAALQNAVLEDTLPPGFVVESTSPAATTVIPGNPAIVRWTLGSLAPGATGSVALTARAGMVTEGTGDPPTQIFTNHAELRGRDAGGAQYSADASADVIVETLALSIGKTVDQSFVATLPATVTYTLTPQYSGNAGLQDVRVIDPIPSGTTYVAGSANAGGTFGAYVPIAAVPGNDPGPPVLDTAITVSSNFVTSGGPVSVTLNVKSSVAIANVSPSDLGDTGGTADCTGPVPATANVPAGGAGVNFGWTCTLNDVAEYVFTASATDALATTSWPIASSASVLSASQGGPGMVTWNLGSNLPRIPGEIITSGYTSGVYGFRGAGTNSFQKYGISADAWTAKANALNNINKGGALTTNRSGIIYGLRGDGQQTFYSYDVATNVWTARANTGVAVSEGGALVYLNVAGTDFVYALMGNGTGFRRYSVATNTWTAMAPTPANVKKGGALTTDGTNIYALRGDTKNTFWRYNVVGNTWTALASVPANVGWGGALTTVDGFIYALRGDGKTSFYRYEIATNTWTAMASTPANVADGGALTTDGASIYAFQGRTQRLWRYDIASNTWTTLASFGANTGQGGALVYVPALNPQGRFTLMTAQPSLVTTGVPITLRIDFESSTAVSNVVPSAPAVTATGGAACSSLSGPTLVSADDDISDIDDVVTYEWICTPSAGPSPGSLRFTAGGTGSGAVAFPAATTKSVLVSPLLSYQATLPVGAPSPVVNTALLIGSGQTVSSPPVITNSGSPSLEITKSNMPGAAALLRPGDPITYTMMVQNTGSGNATGVTVSDAVPTGTSYVACAGGLSCGVSSGVVSWSVGMLLPGQTATLSFIASVRTDLAISEVPYVIANTASVVSEQTDAVNSNTVTNQVEVPARITKLVSPAEASTGETLSYTILVENEGAAFMADVTDVVPAGTSFDGIAGCTPACTWNGSSVTWAGATIQSGINVFTFTVTVTASGGALVTNVAVLDPASPDLDPIESNEVVTQIGPELSIVKFNDPVGPVAVGNSIAYTLVVTNQSDVTAVNVVATDAMPAGTTFVGCTTSSGTCGMSAGVVTWSPGNLPGGESIVLTFHVNVSSPAPGTLQIDNVAVVSAGNSTLPVQSNHVSNPLSSVPVDLAILKTAPVSAMPGGSIDFTIVVTNGGTSEATDVVVDDPTPAGLVFVSNAGACATPFPCVLGTVEAGATRTITSTYSVPASYSGPDPIVNTAIVSSAEADPTPENNTSSASVPLEALADLAIVKTGPASVTPGTNAVFTIIVTNDGPSDAVGVTVADPTPTGLTFVSNSGDCTSAFPCTLGTLASGATRTITATYSVPASYTTPDPVVNTATVSSASPDTDPSNNTDSASSPLAPSADLSVVKVGPGGVSPGTNLVYTIIVTNNGTSDAQSVSVADPTPAGLAFVSNTGDCVSAFPCALGTVEAGGTRTITATYAVPPTYTTPDPIVNVATVASTTPDPVPGNNSDDASTALTLDNADLSVVKTGPASATPGTNVVFTVVVTNNGPDPATTTTVTDTAPVGLTFVSNSGDCTTAYPCALGTLASGATRTITSTYSVPASYSGPDPIVNTAIVSSAEADPTPENNTSSASVPLEARADLAIVKTGPATITAGANAVFTIAVTNLGPSDATGVSVADPTPAGLTFVSNSGHCASAYPCSLGSIPAGATRSITSTYSVPVDYTSPNPVVNTATVSSTTTDPEPSNDTSTVSVPLLDSADLSVVKSDPGTAVVRGDTLTYTVVVTNNGPFDATAVSATDTLDADTTYISDTGGCTEVLAGVLSCPLGDLAVGESTMFTITVSVNGSAPTGGVRENGACNGAEDLCNTIAVSAAQADPTPANNTDTEPTNVAAADLAIVKSDSGEGVNRLEDFAYTIEVTNIGTVDATDVTVVDTLDPDTAYVTDDLGCVEAPVRTLTCALGTMAPGETVTFHVIVKVSASAPSSGRRESGACNGAEDLCNRVTVTAAEGDANPLNNRADEPTDVTATNVTADLSITKTDATGPVQAGAFSTYTVEVTNSGPAAATEVRVVDILDPAMRYVGGTLPCTENPTGMLTCEVGTMAAGATVEFDIIVHVDAGAPTASSVTGPLCPGTEDICNRASVSSPATDPDPTDNVSEVATDVTPTVAVADISLAKSEVGAEPVLPGSDVTYRIVVSNAGPAVAEGVVVHETLDESMAYVSDTAGCTVTTVAGASRTTLACPVGDVPAGSSAEFFVQVTIAADARVDSTMQDGDCNDLEDVCNEVFATSDSADFNLLNNADSEPTDVSLSLTCNDGVVDAGEECDPPSGEVCNNGQDDDGDVAIDCSDPDCQGSGTQSCDGNCQLTPLCVRILDDPARISWNRVYVHGRFISTTPVDPLLEGFRFVISNAEGPIYSVALKPGDMRVRVGRSISRWVYKDRDARQGRGLRDGIYRVGIHQRFEKTGEISYVFSIIGYGDMSAASLSRMTTHVYIGNDVAYLEADWSGKPGAWYLALKDARL